MSEILHKLLKKYDEPARDTTIKYIEGSYSNVDKYGVDILINNKENTFDKIEVQTLAYKTFIDNFRLLTIFKRKDRYDTKTIYITYNYNYSKCFIFCRCQLSKNKMSEINARYSIHKEDKIYFLYKNEVLYIDNINNNTLNIDVLNNFFVKINDENDEDD